MVNEGLRELQSDTPQAKNQSLGHKMKDGPLEETPAGQSSYFFEHFPNKDEILIAERKMPKIMPGVDSPAVVTPRQGVEVQSWSFKYGGYPMYGGMGYGGMGYGGMGYGGMGYGMGGYGGYGMGGGMGMPYGRMGYGGGYGGYGGYPGMYGGGYYGGYPGMGGGYYF